MGYTTFSDTPICSMVFGSPGCFSPFEKRPRFRPPGGADPGGSAEEDGGGGFQGANAEPFWVGGKTGNGKPWVFTPP